MRAVTAHLVRISECVLRACGDVAVTSVSKREAGYSFVREFVFRETYHSAFVPVLRVCVSVRPSRGRALGERAVVSLPSDGRPWWRTGTRES